MALNACSLYLVVLIRMLNESVDVFVAELLSIVTVAKHVGRKEGMKV